MKTRVGIVGCGSIAEFRHAPEYAQNPNAEIVAYFDPQPHRAEKLAAVYGGAVVGDFQAILEDKSIEAVSVCSTNQMHHVHTVQALESGKHVLCEKPLAVSLAAADAMLAASQKSGKILMVGHNQRLADAHQKAKAILQSGELGRVLTFATTFGHPGPEYWSWVKNNSTWFFDKPKSVFGVAGDLGVHKLDLIRYLLDDEIVEVSSFVETLDKKNASGALIEVSDNMLCLLRTKKRAVGTLTVSWTHYGAEDNSTTLYCERGIMKIYADPTYQIQISNAAGQATLYKVGKLQTNTEQSNSGVIDAFIDAIQNNTPPVIPGEDGYRAVQIVLAAIRSSETGQTVKV